MAGATEEAGTPSPEFVVPKLSGPGRKLQALFDLHGQRKFPLGAKVPSEDPDDMIRLRVRVRRSTDSHGVRKFEIEDVLAGHWLGVAESGIPEEAAAESNTEPAPAETRSSG